MHIKRTQMPKAWPIPRKGRKRRFVAVPSHMTRKGIPLLFLLRDVLGIAKTRKEVKYMTHNGMVKVNNKIRRDENFPMQVFDILTLDKANLNYRLEIVNRKFNLIKISAKEAETKIVKISGKKIISEGKVQMNLDDGRNILTKEKFSVGDSVILDTRTGKIVKILPLKEGAKIEVVTGKHAGEKGTLVGVEELVRGRNYQIKLKDKVVSLPYKTILVIG